MYKKIQNRQEELTDFNQLFGFKINPLNRWVFKASTSPWDAIEKGMHPCSRAIQDRLQSL